MKYNVTISTKEESIFMDNEFTSFIVSVINAEDKTSSVAESIDKESFLYMLPIIKATIDKLYENLSDKHIKNSKYGLDMSPFSIKKGKNDIAVSIDKEEEGNSGKLFDEKTNIVLFVGLQKKKTKIYPVARVIGIKDYKDLTKLQTIIMEMEIRYKQKLYEKAIELAEGMMKFENTNKEMTDTTIDDILGKDKNEE